MAGWSRGCQSGETPCARSVPSHGNRFTVHCCFGGPVGLVTFRHKSRGPPETVPPDSHGFPSRDDRLASTGSDDVPARSRERQSDPARDLGRSVRRNGRGRQEGKGDPFLRRVGRQSDTPSPRDAAPIGGEADGVPVGARSLVQPLYLPDGLRVERPWQHGGRGGDRRMFQEGIANLADHHPESAWRLMRRNRSSEATTIASGAVNSGKTGRDWQLFRLFHAFPMYWVSRLCDAETLGHVFVKPLSIRKDATCRPQRHPRSLGSCRSPPSGTGRKRSANGLP